MRIISPHCGAEAQSQSGGEVYERELLKGLGEAGDEVHAILARHKTAPPGVQVVHRPPVWRGLRWWVTPFVWPPAIRYCWSACGPADLLRAHSVRYAGPSCLAARRWLGLRVPIVTHIHHLDPSPLNGLIERRVLHASDLVVTDSTFAASQLTRELDLPKSKIRVVRSGIADRYRPDPEAAARWDWPGRVVVAACGQLIERKDPVAALHVMERLRRRGYERKVGLVWIGEGPLRGVLETMIQSQGLSEMVRLPGYVDEDTKLAILNRCDLFLHTSTLEGFALAPQEAMACGKPVVMRRAASATEMVQHGRTGFIGTSLGDLTYGVGRLIDHRTMRLAMGEAAQAWAEAMFRWRYTLEGVRAAYREAVEQYRPGAQVSLDRR